MRSPLTLVVFVLCMALPGVVGWDGEGHRIIARIAGCLMTPKAARYIREHLVESGRRVSKEGSIRALVECSTWADTVDDTLPWSSVLHFSHTPFQNCQTYNADRDCGFDGSGRCIVTGIANYTARAADVTLSRSERTDAIKFLVHLVADAHQGLHVGFAEDFGGTAIKLTEPAEHSLHEAWDSYLLSEHRKTLPTDSDNSWFGIATNLITELARDDLRTIFKLASPSVATAMEFAAAIVSDTAVNVTCVHAYQSAPSEWIKTGDLLSPAYVESRGQVMLVQFMKAGVRLGQLLDTVAAEYYRAERAVGQVAAGAGEFSSPMRTTRFPWDFEPEDYLYEVEDVSPHVELMVAVPVAVISATTTTVVPIVRSPEERKRIKRLKDKARDAAKKRRFMGVDLDAVVLIKRGRKLFITYRHKVVNEFFVPRQASLISVQFAPTDVGVSNVVRFGLDAELIQIEGAVVPKELLSAIFRRLRGIPGGDVFHAAADGEDFETTTYDAVPSKLLEMAAESAAYMASIGPTAEPIVNPFDQTFKQVPFGSVSHLLTAPLIASELRKLYLGRLPSENERVNDLFFSQQHRVVIINLGPIVLMSRDDLLLDRSIDRWFFNTLTVSDPNSAIMTAQFLYIDARMLEAEPTVDVLGAIGAIASRRINMELKRRVLKARPPILDALKSLADSFMNRDALLRWATAVSELNAVIRPDRTETKMVELVLRSPEDMVIKRAILSRLLARAVDEDKA